MRNKNLKFKNNLNYAIRNNFSKKFIGNFDKIFLNLEKDIKNKKNVLNVLDSSYSFTRNIFQLKKFRKYKKIAIIGMGGSILGTEAIYGLLKRKIKKKFFFFNDLNEQKIVQFKKKEKTSQILFIIISKSGNTIETLSNAFSLGIVKKNAKNIIIITEKKNNFLFNLSKSQNLYFIEHKNFIGGRYSVLSETGIIPSYLMELKIDRLRSKLLNFFNGVKKKFLKESVLSLTKIFQSKKYKNLVFLNYSPELEKLLFWCQQLIAESLGKNNMGFFPVVSNVPKDHHSLLQLYLDGPKDKIFYIFSDEESYNIKINFNINSEKNYLNNKLLSSVKDAQKKALIKAFTEKKIPFREFKIKKNDEAFIGELFSYFILETVLIGKLSKINPFSQPAVEQVKIYTKNYLT